MVLWSTPLSPFCRLQAMEQTVKQSTWREGFFLSSCTNKTLALLEISEQDSPWIECEYPNYLWQEASHEDVSFPDSVICCDSLGINSGELKLTFSWVIVKWVFHCVCKSTQNIVSLVRRDYSEKPRERHRCTGRHWKTLFFQPYFGEGLHYLTHSGTRIHGICLRPFFHLAFRRPLLQGLPLHCLTHSVHLLPIPTAVASPRLPSTLSLWYNTGFTRRSWL